MALETQIGRDGAEVWRLLAEFPYSLEPLIWPRMRLVELQCDRSAALVVSPEDLVSALSKLSVADDDVEYAREYEHQQGDSDPREQIEWPSTHPTLVERATAVGVSLSALENARFRAASGQAARILIPELDSIRQELLDETEGV